jgi:hypothetical protein
LVEALLEEEEDLGGKKQQVEVDRPASSVVGGTRPGRPRRYSRGRTAGTAAGAQDLGDWALLWPTGVAAAGAQDLMQGSIDLATRGRRERGRMAIQKFFESIDQGYISPSNDLLGCRNSASTSYISGRREYISTEIDASFSSGFLFI